LGGGGFRGKVSKCEAPPCRTLSQKERSDCAAGPSEQYGSSTVEEKKEKKQGGEGVGHIRSHQSGGTKGVWLPKETPPANKFGLYPWGRKEANGGTVTNWAHRP